MIELTVIEASVAVLTGLWALCVLGLGAGGLIADLLGETYWAHKLIGWMLMLFVSTFILAGMAVAVGLIAIGVRGYVAA